MKAIILAAGRGSRLAPLTDDLPKCLTIFRGRRLIDQIAIVTGYRAKLLSGLVPVTFYNARWSSTQVVRSLGAAASWLREDVCIVSYSDIYYESAAIVALMKARGNLVVGHYPKWRALWEARFEAPLRDAETFKLDHDGFLTDIGGTASTLDEICGQFAGLVRFTPEGWSTWCRYLSTLRENELDRLDMTKTLRALVRRAEKIAISPIEGQWFEIDDLEDLTVSESMWVAEPITKV